MPEEYPEGNFKKIAAIINPHRSSAEDSASTSLTIGEIDEIRGLTQDEIHGRMVELEGGFQSLDEARRDAGRRVGKMLSRAMDGYQNTVSGVGTDIDPGMYNSAYVPLSLSPDEATGIYASGGIPAKIIDKKSEGIILNGYTYDGLEDADSKKLVEYGEERGFSPALIDGVRDGLIYGGALVIPHLRGDSAISYLKSYAELEADGLLGKDCIDRFWTADRWNAVLVPDFNLSAESFVNPKSFFIPMAGLEVKSSRMAVIRPKKLPYWGMIRQVGWSVSDIEGWMRSVLAYEISIMAIPTMAQQISLLYHHIPLDGLIVQNGPEAYKEFARANSEELRKWSIINPKTLNSYGEIKILDRTYTGYWDLIKILQEDVGAKSDISNNILFHQNPTGFSENEKDVTMMQSEVAKRIANIVAPQLKNITRLLVISCFGLDSAQAKNLGKIKINFNPPQMITNEERSETGTAFVNALKTLVSEVGLPGKSALALAQSLMPGAEVPAEILKDFEELDGAGEGTPPNLGGLLKGISI